MAKTEITLPEGKFVTFSKNDNETIARAHVGAPITIISPQHFEDYRAEARMVIKVLKGECSPEEAQELAEFSYNAMGLNSFLAALAYEILDQKSHL